MILNSTDDRRMEGNLRGETVQMGISDIRLIIDRLTDLYGDRELACIREYSTNAWDAHVEAGVTAPIEVSTPGPLAPFLTIRDFGVGLTWDDIREIYSQYGASTKRNTNDQTGALGLGCKSALSYSDQFTVTSIKDGVRIQVAVSRDPNKGATMKRIGDPERVSDPNGTTILIPVRENNRFDDLAKAFFRYWPKGTVKLNGQEPEFMPHGKKVKDDIYLLEPGERQSYVVMGKVPYPAEINHGLGWGKAVVAFVPIGSVDFAPSRESLMDTDTTQKTLRRVSDEFRAALTQSIKDDIESSSTPAEAARKQYKWAREVQASFLPKNVTYKGQLVPDSYKCEYDTTVCSMYSYSRKLGAHTVYRKDQYLPLPTVNGSLWVTGFDYVSFTATVRKKLDKYVSDNNIVSEGSYILTTPPTKPTTTWMENVTFVDWQTVKAIKLPRAPKNSTLSGRIPGSYDLYYADEGMKYGVPGDEIDTTNDVFWMIGGRYTGAGAIHNKLLESYPDCTLVVLRDGRQAKFERLFPSAKEATGIVKAQFEAWKGTINKDDARAMHMCEYSDSRLEKLDESKLADPDIKRIKQVMNRDTSKIRAEIQDWQCLGYHWHPADEDVENPLEKYVLLPDYYYFSRSFKNHEDHIYSYMNHAYRTEFAK